VKIKRAYKTELKPNKAQRDLLINHAGAARFAYNWGLSRKNELYRTTGNSTNAIDLHRELNALKKAEFNWLYEVSKCAPQEALRDLDNAFKHFFRRLELKRQKKLKGKVGYPHFKSKKRGLGSFRLTGSLRVGQDRIKLPRLGWIRLKEKGYLPCESDVVHILSATVSERAGRWFVSLQVEEHTDDTVPAAGPVVGIDLGVKKLAVCSYGEDDHVHYENPKALCAGEKKLAKLQRKLSRQEKGSNRREATRKKISRQHYRISCIRSDAIHKTTSDIVARTKPPTTRPSVIALEDLNVSGMMKNRKLAKAVADASMREFRRQMEYKCGWHGTRIFTVPRFQATSKLCSRCGWTREDLELKDRTFVCDACGYVQDRDANASDNLRLLAASSAERINGRGGDVRPSLLGRQSPAKRQLKPVG
jgi:putative transposase